MTSATASPACFIHTPAPWSLRQLSPAASTAHRHGSFMRPTPRRCTVTATPIPRASLRFHRSTPRASAQAPRRVSLPRVADAMTSLFPVWVTLGAICAYVHPPTFLWFRSSYIVPTLSLIMLGMGLTITPASFAAVFATPRRVLLGAAAQYTVMPFLARLLAVSLRLPAPLAAGLILVGVCPGGAASNLVCLIAHADVALSVVLTLISTLLSVVLIPILMQLLAGTLVPVSASGLLLSTAQVVLVPLGAGAVLKRIFPGAVQRVLRILPLISVLGVACICAGVVASSAGIMHGVGLRLVVAVAVLHAMGGVVGYCIARAFRLPIRSARTVSIEVMMQNSSLAVSLANVHFANPLTAIPGAISATMHSIFGSLLAGAWRLSDSRAAANRSEALGADGAPEKQKRPDEYRILEE